MIKYSDEYIDVAREQELDAEVDAYYAARQEKQEVQRLALAASLQRLAKDFNLDDLVSRTEVSNALLTAAAWIRDH